MKKFFGTIIIALLFLSLFSSQVQAVEESIIEAEKSPGGIHYEEIRRQSGSGNYQLPLRDL